MDNKFIINDQEYSSSELSNFAEKRISSSSTPEWEKDLYHFIIQWFSPVEYISIFTSGSTGTPKEIKLLKTDMIKSANRSNTFFELKQRDNALLCLSVKYIAGMMMVVRAFCGKLNLISIPPHQLEEINKLIDFAAMVPLQIEKLLAQPTLLNKIAKIIIGGAPLNETLTKRLLRKYKGTAWETYGMTETITHVAIKEIKKIKNNNIFYALPGINFAQDNRNCLIIKDELIQPKPLITNDHIQLVSKTSFRLLGRYDNVINTGGIKVQPEELEAKLHAYINGKFCITSMPDNKLGEIVLLIIEKGAEIINIENGLSAITNYQKPKRIIELDKIPLLNNGKIDRIALKKLI